MYFVYILKLSDGRYYKGRTDNLSRRLREHPNGKTYSIRKYLPFELIHVDIVENLNEAIKLELYFKSGIGREIIRELFN